MKEEWEHRREGYGVDLSAQGWEYGGFGAWRRLKYPRYATLDAIPGPKLGTIQWEGVSGFGIASFTEATREELCEWLDALTALGRALGKKDPFEGLRGIGAFSVTQEPASGWWRAEFYEKCQAALRDAIIVYRDSRHDAEAALVAMVKAWREAP